MDDFAEFEEFHALLEAERFGTINIGERIREHYKDKQVLLAFCDYISAKPIPGLAELKTPCSPSSFTELVSTMNFNNSRQRDELQGAMSGPTVPWIRVGKDKLGNIYRILPYPHGLYPDRIDPRPSEEHPLVLDTEVLGVNTKVPYNLDQPGQDILSEYESDDTDEDGFVFHQLGLFQLWSGSEEELDSRSGRDRRGPTGFCAVVAVARNGCEDGIYIVHNFRPEDEYEFEERIHIDHDVWGYLPYPGNHLPVGQFSLARIADKFTDLGREYVFNINPERDEHFARHRVELVRARSTPQGFIIRANTQQPGSQLDLQTGPEAPVHNTPPPAAGFLRSGAPRERRKSRR